MSRDVSGVYIEMFNCAIHVFVGAPTVPQSLPRCAEGHCNRWRHEWKERRYLWNEECADDLRACGAQPLRLLFSPPLCSETPSGLSEPLSLTIGSQHNCNWVLKEDSRYTGDISDLVSITKHCHITTHLLHGSIPKVWKPQDTCDNSNECTANIADFFTIWTSSQMAAQGHITTLQNELSFAEIKTELSITRYKGEIEYCTAAVSAERKAPAQLALKKPGDEYFSSSLELFSQRPNEDNILNKPSSLCLQTEICELNLKEAERLPSTCYNYNSDCRSTNCKRKEAFTWYLDSNSQYDSICKKFKQSISPVKSVNKEYHNKRQQRTITSTLLKHCIYKNTHYNILAAVMQPCHVKEIKVESGTNYSSSVPLATVVVLDQSEIYHKVLLWRCAASWSLALTPGDIIMLTNLTLCENKWNKEILLQSTYRSGMVYLGNWLPISADCSNITECSFLKELLNYISTKQYYLRDFCSNDPQKLDCIQHVRFSQLQPELLVHSVLKVDKIMILKEYTYHFKGLPQNKVILTVEEVKGQHCTLILWGESVSWCSQIRHKKNHIWLFKYLLCRKNLISEELELHSTPWSTLECLFDDDNRAIDFRLRYFKNQAPPSNMSNLMATNKDRYSGVIEIKGIISKLEFYVPGNKIVLMTHNCSITNILMSLPSVIYTGCGKCRKDLKIDNYLYEQCFDCLPFNQVRTFYKPATMTVMSETSRICIHVPSEIIQTIFLNISPNLLCRIIAGSTSLTYGAIVADMCQSLLADTGELYVLSMKSQITLDENSMPFEQEFHLLNFHANI
ncbi:shieldin complex subunit 2 [Hyperolius riggenbachi]|uniref:shieldin complex subunit 2 n=1 Tax=Hyperolius riggenbachi TaxID=752182 RepID=UPI0035A372FA